MPLINKFILILVICTSLSACYSTKTTSNWPDTIPDRSIFIDAYKKQVAEGRNNNSEAIHLRWIKRFYNGLSIYPGWNDMTKAVIDSMSEYPVNQQKDTSRRLAQLGQKIAIEWAQSNSTRNIDSANINVWGNALRTSVKREDQLGFITRVERDVKELIDRELDMRAITPERYYPVEEIDDF